jgi:hypothetical protein
MDNATERQYATPFSARAQRRWNPWRIVVCPLRAFSLALLAFLSAALPIAAQLASFAAPAAYNIQPGTIPIAVTTGQFSSSGLLDFAVLEQNTSASVYQVEVFHGQTGGTFCTNCSFQNPNPDVVPLSATVTSATAIAAPAPGQGPSGGLLAVATNSGIAILQANSSGTFTLNSTMLAVPGNSYGFVSLTIGQFDGSDNLDIAAVFAVPSIYGISTTLAIFFGESNGTFSVNPAFYAINLPECPFIGTGTFQSQPANQQDLILFCYQGQSTAEGLVFFNLLDGGGFSSTADITYRLFEFGSSVPVMALGDLYGISSFFVKSASFAAEQNSAPETFTSDILSSNGSTALGNGVNAFVVLPDSANSTDFAVLNHNVLNLTTFTPMSLSGSTINGNWNQLDEGSSWNPANSLGPATTLAAGLSSATQSPIVVAAGADTKKNYNGSPYIDERSVSVFPVPLNPLDGTIAATTAPAVYSGTGTNSGLIPSAFAVGDFVGSGIVNDLAVGGVDTSTGDPTISIYLGTGNTLPATLCTPSAPTVCPPGSVVEIPLGNYDGADAVVAGKFRTTSNTPGNLPVYDLAVYLPDQITILTSNGNGTFTVGNTYSLAGAVGYPGFSYVPPFAPVLTAVDINGDGSQDIVLTLPQNAKSSTCGTSVAQGAVYVLISNGDGSFQAPVYIPPPVENPVSMTAAKFFMSPYGVPDLAFADGGDQCSSNTATTVGKAVGLLQNNSYGPGPITEKSFPAYTILSNLNNADLNPPNVTTVASADMNNDGLPDLVISNTGGIQVLLNNPNSPGTFTPTQQTSSQPLPLYGSLDMPQESCGGSTGCVSYDSQLVTGNFFASGPESDVAASVNGIVYLFQNPPSNGSYSGTLAPLAQGFVAGPNSQFMSAAMTNSGGLADLLIGTSQGTVWLANYGTGNSSPVPTPIISPPGGTFTSSQQVTISDANSNAAIYYTTDGTPTTSSIPYTGPFTVSATETVNAIAILGGTESSAAAALFTISESNTSTTTMLTASAQTIALGQSVTLTAAVLADGTPVTVGSVTFSSNGAAIGTGSLNSSGQATLSTSALPTGTDSITAGYVASATFANSTSSPVSISVSAYPLAVVTDNETITVTDAPSFPDIADNESITVTDAVTVIVYPALTITTATMPNGGVGASYSATISTNEPATFSFTGALPAGLTLSSTGTLSGTPTTAGSYSFTIIVTSSFGSATSQSYTVVISPPIAITTTILPDGVVGVSYAQTIIANQSATFSVTSGTLPSGLTLASSGTLSGVPTTPSSYTFTITATSLFGSSVSQSYTVMISTVSTITATAGYWLFESGGPVFAFGDTHFYGSTTHPSAAIVGMQSAPGGEGYWLVESSGVVLAFGDAHFYGSATHSSAVIVGMQSTPDGKGYWLVSSDGGVYAFGGAHNYGSIEPTVPIVGMQSTPDGKGYWLVSSEGEVYAFGDALFYGRASNPAAQIVGMQSTADGKGYWLAGSDGTVYRFGDALFYGGATNPTAPIVGMQSTADGKGYWLAGSDGTIYTFGDAPYEGSITLTATIAGMATVLPAPTTTVVTSSATSSEASYIGQPVTFASTITSTFGSIPNGETVTFYDGNTEAGSELGTSATSDGVATYTTSALSVKTHTIYAVYAGDSNFKSSSGSVKQVVSLYPSATTVAANPNPSAFGQSVTLSASVTSNAPNGASGTVAFKNGTTALGTATLSAGTAALTTTKLPLGSDAVTATYNGDAENAEDTSSSITVTVNQAMVNMTLTSTPNPSTVGKSVKFTATLTSNGGLPDGQTVTFMWNGAALGTSTIGSGKANFSTTALPVGSDQVTATYGGNGDYSSASATITQTVN